MNGPISVSTDQSSTIPYKYPDIPIFTIMSNLAIHGYEALCHWHPDLELLCVYSGSMDVFINGQIVHLSTGECIFINSRRLHYHFSGERNDCKYFLVIIDLSAMHKQNSIVSAFLRKKFNLNVADYLILHHDIPWEREVIKSVKALHKAMNEDEINPLRLLELGCGICANIGEHIADSDKNEDSGEGQVTFLNMIAYIHNHFSERITLENIAAAGAICRSKCCTIFKQQVKQSPTSYLIQYRIAKSCEFLRNSDMSIGEIANQCGFQSSSYFTNVFQKHTNCSPREYRMRNR